MCTDGTLEVLCDASERKADLRGIISAQIKGTTSKPKPALEPTRSISVIDLEKYRDVYRGVIYFVVFMNSDLTNKKIFYKQFLPFDLDQIIKKARAEGKKTIKQRLMPLPQNKEMLRRLCDEFVDNQEKQLSGYAAGFKSYDGWIKSGGKFKAFEIPKRIANLAELAVLDTWANGGYFYGVTEEGHRHAIERIENVTDVSIGTDTEIASGDYSTEMLVMQGEDHEGRYLTLGGFRICLNKPALSYTPTGTFHELLRDAKIAREIARCGQLRVGISGFQGIRFTQVDLDELDERARILEKYVALLDLLGIKDSLSPKNLSDRDLKIVRRLGAAFVDGAHIDIPEFDQAILNLDIDLSMGRIKVIARRCDDGGYVFWDTLGADTVCMLTKDHPDNTASCSPLPTTFLLTVEDFKKSINIDSDKFVDSLTKTPLDVSNSEAACNKLLDMLDAYDQGAFCSKELLECCLILVNGLLAVDSQNQNYQINRAQILKRKNQLQEDDRAAIRAIALASDSSALRAAAYIILGETEMAEDCINMMEDAEQKQFCEWPIYRLLHDSKRTEEPY